MRGKEGGTPFDRSQNPYRRFFTRDRNARDLVPGAMGAPQRERKEEMDTSCVDFRHALNIELVEKAEGYVKVSMKVLEGYVNRIGSLHGGLLYTLADSACGAAVLTYGNKATTLNGNIDYLKPGIGCKELTAEARVIKMCIRDRTAADGEEAGFEKFKKQLNVNHHFSSPRAAKTATPARPDATTRMMGESPKKTRAASTAR